MGLTHGSLFSGIGGFERVGFKKANSQMKAER